MLGQANLISCFLSAPTYSSSLLLQHSLFTWHTHMHFWLVN